MRFLGSLLFVTLNQPNKQIHISVYTRISMTQSLKILLMLNVAWVSKCATALNQMKNYPQDKRRSEVSALELF